MVLNILLPFFSCPIPELPLLEGRWWSYSSLVRSCLLLFYVNRYKFLPRYFGFCLAIKKAQSVLKDCGLRVRVRRSFFADHNSLLLCGALTRLNLLHH